jgi:hypothetical protein
MAKWSLKCPKEGDIIRVSIGNNIHHYGIYVSDSCIIQYGKASDIFQDSSEVSVFVGTIKEFVGNKYIEVREYSLIEKLKKNSKEKIIKKAKERIGEKKYNILNNNCEHFVNECVFNKHESLEAKQYSENRH